MRVTNVSVKKLFGIFDHEIPMDKPEGVTIIHGPNGFGKTVMLKMIAGALSAAPSIFHSVPFIEFKMDLDDGTAWIVRPKSGLNKDKAPTNDPLGVFIRDRVGNETELRPTEEQTSPRIYRN